MSLQVYSIRTRSRAADIFNTCASLICAMEDDNLVRKNSALCMVCHLACDGEGVSTCLVYGSQK